MKKRDSTRKRRNVYQDPVVLGAIITGAVAVVVALIQVWPQLGGSQPQNNEPSMPTPLIVPPSSTEPVGQTEDLSTLEVPATQSSTLPAPTAETTVLQLETPTPSLPTLDCPSEWVRVKTVSLPAKTPLAPSTTPDLAGCSIPEFVITTNGSDELNFSMVGLRDSKGLLGISHPIQYPIENGYTIQFKVILSTLFKAEFWVALSEGEIPTADNDKYLVVEFVPQYESGQKLSGTVVVYQGGGKRSEYKWPKNPAVKVPPFIYTVRIRVAAGQVVVTVNSREVRTLNGILPKYLFFGYSKEVAAGAMDSHVILKELTFTPVSDR